MIKVFEDFEMIEIYREIAINDYIVFTSKNKIADFYYGQVLRKYIVSNVIYYFKINFGVFEKTNNIVTIKIDPIKILFKTKNIEEFKEFVETYKIVNKYNL